MFICIQIYLKEVKTIVSMENTFYIHSDIIKQHIRKKNHVMLLTIKGFLGHSSITATEIEDTPNITGKGNKSKRKCLFKLNIQYNR